MSLLHFGFKTLASVKRQKRREGAIHLEKGLLLLLFLLLLLLLLLRPLSPSSPVVVDEQLELHHGRKKGWLVASCFPTCDAL